ncbi:MAG: 16S rRNA (adenine(1518)-N(6)/adenine(1519)-N(6))-dimethyltransferase RsmA [candidate division Zixibacteria bacterium]
MVTAKRRFGQNFLTDPKKAAKLVDSLEIREGETVIEIGPGTGILTQRLLDKGADLVAVELDRDLIPALQERFGSFNRFRLMEDDIIDVDPTTLSPSGFKVIGNLPYNISGAVVEWLIEYFGLIDLAVITVQKEVADRLRADHGCRDYGSLTVLARSFFDISRLFNIPPGCFSPKPKVISTVLRFWPDKKLADEILYPDFKNFIRGCFFQKRKKLTNSLAAALGKDKNIIEKRLRTLGKTNDCRAEELSLSEFYDLYRLML